MKVKNKIYISSNFHLIIAKHIKYLMSYSTFNTKLEGEIAILTISRPESLNALNSLFFQELKKYSSKKVSGGYTCKITPKYFCITVCK